ncbi:MAG: glycosyltransferase [Hyphomicrobiaceae bacterium]|nr:MAG: glycosyltransferase [Hyphomicrobiaceae bacterium]
MRILHVMASRANGGAETYSTDMIESLHAAGIEQLAVIPRASIHHDRLAQAGVPLASGVLDVPVGLWRRHKLRQAIEAFRPDLVHCWMRRAASLVPRLDVPVIGWFGGYYEPAYFSRCTHFVGVTPGIVDHMVARGVARERATYIQTFPTLDSGAALDRASLATPKDAVLLLALSRLHEKKGLDILLQALAALPRCVAWLAGDGPLEAELKALAAKLGVSDRVRFLGWRTDRGALLRTADICVLPSRWEPFGTVMLEAWAAGTPLVAAASQGPAVLIEDGVNGLLVPVDDVEALAAAIQRLIDDPALKARLIERGAKDYQQGFTREAVTERMMALYRQLIAEHAKAAGARALSEERV